LLSNKHHPAHSLVTILAEICQPSAIHMYLLFSICLLFIGYCKQDGGPNACSQVCVVSGLGSSESVSFRHTLFPTNNLVIK